MEENKELYLNEYGLIVFKHKTNKRLFLERTYHWKDNITLLDETEGRQVIMCQKYSTFNTNAWQPITKEEYSKVDKKYTDIYK